MLAAAITHHPDLQRFQHPHFAIDMVGAAQRFVDMYKAQAFLQRYCLSQKAGCFQITAAKTVLAGKIHCLICQLAR